MLGLSLAVQTSHFPRTCQVLHYISSHCKVKIFLTFSSTSVYIQMVPVSKLCLSLLYWLLSDHILINKEDTLRASPPASLTTSLPLGQSHSSRVSPGWPHGRSFTKEASAELKKTMDFTSTALRKLLMFYFWWVTLWYCACFSSGYPKH